MGKHKTKLYVPKRTISPITRKMRWDESDIFIYKWEYNDPTVIGSIALETFKENKLAWKGIEGVFIQLLKWYSVVYTNIDSKYAKKFMDT